MNKTDRDKILESPDLRPHYIKLTEQILQHNLFEFVDGDYYRFVAFRNINSRDHLVEFVDIDNTITLHVLLTKVEQKIKWLEG